MATDIEPRDLHRHEQMARLQEAIRVFASSSVLVQRNTLQSLLGSITPDFVDQDTLQPHINQDVQQALKESLVAASQTPFAINTPAGEDLEVMPWEGGFTGVAIDLNTGQILAAVTRQVGRVYESTDPRSPLKRNLLAAALKKSIIALHLKRAHQDGNIDNPNSWRYITQLLRGVELFLGTETASQITINGAEYAIAFGCSGFGLTLDYLKGLVTPPMAKAIDVDFLAGAGDQAGLGLAIMYLQTLGKPTTQPESPDLELFRRRH